jgi:hypothetical protein
MVDEASGLSWEYDIPLLNNRYMLWDFARVFLATFLLSDLILLLATGFEFEAVIPLTGVGVAIFMALFILVSLFLRNRIRTLFVLDADGVGSKVSRSMSKLNRVTVVLGALAGSPSVAGAGLLAASSEESFFPWSGIVKATVDRRRRVISFHNSWRTLQRVYCYDDNFDQVLGYVSDMLPGKLVFESRIGGS